MSLPYDLKHGYILQVATLPDGSHVSEQVRYDELNAPVHLVKPEESSESQSQQRFLYAAITGIRSHTLDLHVASACHWRLSSTASHVHDYELILPNSIVMVVVFTSYDVTSLAKSTAYVPIICLR